MKRKILVKKRALFGMSLPATIASVLLLAVLGGYVGKLGIEYYNDIKLNMAIEEAIAVKDDVQNFSLKASQEGEPYIHYDGTKLNAEKLRIYTTLKFSLNGSSGASSYFCSKTTFSCKMKYYFSTGANDDSWSIFIDGSEALATYDAESKGRYEDEIARGYTNSGYNPVVNHSATAISAVTTDVTASVANNEDGVFEIGNL